MTQLDSAPATQQAVRPGRKRDHTRDPEIMTAAMDVLAEVGYERMTVDMVAARAKAGKATLYRRWPSKADLVLDAVSCMGAAKAGVLPDTGSLRGDLVALLSPRTVHDADHKLKVMLGLASVIAHSPELAESIREAFLEPRAAVTRALLQRAKERGEIAPDCDVELLSTVSSSMVISRAMLEHRPVDRAFLLSVIDGVIIPAAGTGPAR
ncbi:TetR/AcrR family transcriptional regulator [Amnibacterium sp.]|uniref:TetR/AcrR family transcriptional regulator n=1 Tax=Amnibacterium sp. TaxID=1872496 RepID=UPI002615A2DE|nr:TetR/AcrR family transcriptional regulator [Amnibacterium sp.]MCU1474792.1 AcrR family transcriptional regulator [Amnibacterium sp.]